MDTVGDPFWRGGSPIPSVAAVTFTGELQVVDRSGRGCLAPMVEANGLRDSSLNWGSLQRKKRECAEPRSQLHPEFL